MKLRNKKTGEIVDFNDRNFITSKDYGFKVYISCDKDDASIVYNSLAELNAEWCDVEDDDES